MRSRAGWFVALLYLFCVVASAASFAFASEENAAACPMDQGHARGIVHFHEHGAAASQHVHEDGRHSNNQANFGDAAVVDAAATVAGDASTSVDDDKVAGATCCGMVCVSALSATPTEIIKPSSPISACIAERYPSVPDEAPVLRYRPPIS